MSQKYAWWPPQEGVLLEGKKSRVQSLEDGIVHLGLQNRSVVAVGNLATIVGAVGYVLICSSLFFFFFVLLKISRTLSQKSLRNKIAKCQGEKVVFGPPLR